MARAYLQINPGIEQVALVCLTNWLSEERQREISKLLERPVLFPALIEGRFCFEPDPQFPLPALPLSAVATSAVRYHDEVAADPARTGIIAGRWRLPALPKLARDQPLAVIGTGEYAYTPFRVALALEEQGYDVRFQSTTRSPILVGDAIKSRLEFWDHYGEGIPNYLYNLDPQRLAVVCYEHPTLLKNHHLADDLGGLAWVTEPT